MPIDRHVLSPEKAQEARAKLEAEQQSDGWRRQRLLRECQAAAYGWDVGRDSNALALYEGRQREIADVDRVLARRAASLAELAARAAAWTPADAERAQMPAEWRRRLEAAKDLLALAKTGPPALQKLSAIEAFVSAWTSLHRFSETVEAALCQPGEHPYASRTEVSAATMLGPALAARIRPAKPAASLTAA